MKEIIKNILVQNQELDLTSRLLPRESGLSLGINKIQAITGPRRVGKTSALLLAIDELKKKEGIPAREILYFNFEDERIQFKQSFLDLLLQGWQELFRGTNLSKMWFFFDEVQAAPGWEKFLNRINERFTGKIIFTGSNSAVLHTHIKSVMRGRSIAVEMLPLSFKTYCNFRKIIPAAYGKGRAETIAVFSEFLEKGGYPEIVNLEPGLLNTSYLQEYYNAMLLRDI